MPVQMALPPQEPPPLLPSPLQHGIVAPAVAPSPRLPHASPQVSEVVAASPPSTAAGFNAAVTGHAARATGLSDKETEKVSHSNDGAEDWSPPVRSGGGGNARPLPQALSLGQPLPTLVMAHSPQTSPRTRAAALGSHQASQVSRTF